MEIFEGEYVLILKFYSRQKVKESTILVSMLMGNIFFHKKYQNKINIWLSLNIFKYKKNIVFLHGHGEDLKKT